MDDVEQVDENGQASARHLIPKPTYPQRGQRSGDVLSALVDDRVQLTARVRRLRSRAFRPRWCRRIGLGTQVDCSLPGLRHASVIIVSRGTSRRLFVQQQVVVVVASRALPPAVHIFVEVGGPRHHEAHHAPLQLIGSKIQSSATGVVDCAPRNDHWRGQRAPCRSRHFITRSHRSSGL